MSQVLRGLLLAALVVPVWSWAQAVPTVANNAATVVTGGSTWIYPYTATTWTGSVLSLTYTIGSAPQRGSLQQPYYFQNNESYYCAYQAAAGYVGTDSFTWRASIGTQISAVATCLITITANHAPVARPISCTTSSGVTTTRLVHLSSYVTHSDSGQTMSYYLTTPAAHGYACFIAGNGKLCTTY